MKEWELNREMEESEVNKRVEMLWKSSRPSEVAMSTVNAKSVVDTA